MGRADARPLKRGASARIRGSSVTRAIALIGDRWAILVVRDAFQGVRRFEEFLQRTGASRATLTRRLRSLEASGLLRRVRSAASPGRTEYRLTDMGRDLFALSLVAWRWERSWAPRGAGIPARLRHAACGHDLVPETACAACDRPLALADLEHRRGPGRLPVLRAGPGRGLRKSASTADTQRGSQSSLTHIADIVGDPWSPLLVAAAFFGVRRFDAFQRELGIATNVLSARLESLVDRGIFARQPYQSHPPRHEYRLMPRGRDLLDYALVLNSWGDRWLAPARGPAYQLVHRPCGHVLVTAVRCRHCRGVARPEASERATTASGGRVPRPTSRRRARGTARRRPRDG